MPDGSEPAPPGRTRRSQLTVAELLARHAAEDAPPAHPGTQDSWPAHPATGDSPNARPSTDGPLSGLLSDPLFDPLPSWVTAGAPSDLSPALPPAGDASDWWSVARRDDGLPVPRRPAPPAEPAGTEQFPLGRSDLFQPPEPSAPSTTASRLAPPSARESEIAPRAPAPLDGVGQGHTDRIYPGGIDLLGSSTGIGSRPPPGAPDDTPTTLVPRLRAPDSGHPDGPSASAEQAEQAEQAAEDLARRARKIDESLVRLTAIHAGMGSEMSDRVSRSSRLPKVERAGRSDPGGDEPSGPAGGQRWGGGGQPGGGGQRWGGGDPAGGGDRPGGGSAGPLGGGRPAGLLRVARAGLVALAVVAFVATGVGWGTKNWLDAKLRPVAALDPNSESIVDKSAQAGDLNYLLVGSDSRAGVESGSDDADQVGGARAVPGARPDTVLLAHIPANRDRLVLVSFPRDLQVDRPNCDRWDQASADYPGGTSPAESAVKLNSAFEIGGPRCVTKVVQKLTGLSVNHFTAIDFAGFKDMVDAVQGAPICLDRPVVALLRKGLSEQVLLSPGKLRAFVSTFGSHTLSDNTGLDELSTLAGSLRNLDPSKITFVTVPTVGEPNAQGNEVPRDADAAALFTAIRADQPMPAEVAANSAAGDDSAPRVAAADTVAPSQVTLTVRNGSSRSGLANQVANSLRSVGFTVERVDDAEPTEGGASLIRHSPDRAGPAAAVAAAVPGAVTRATSGRSGLLELVLGDDFDGEVKAAAVSATPDAPLPANRNTVNAADASCR